MISVAVKSSLQTFLPHKRTIHATIVLRLLPKKPGVVSSGLSRSAFCCLLLCLPQPRALLFQSLFIKRPYATVITDLPRYFILCSKWCTTLQYSFSCSVARTHQIENQLLRCCSTTRLLLSFWQHFAVSINWFDVSTDHSTRLHLIFVLSLQLPSDFSKSRHSTGRSTQTDVPPFSRDRQHPAITLQNPAFSITSLMCCDLISLLAFRLLAICISVFRYIAIRLQFSPLGSTANCALQRLTKIFTCLHSI